MSRLFAALAMVLACAVFPAAWAAELGSFEEAKTQTDQRREVQSSTTVDGADKLKVEQWKVATWFELAEVTIVSIVALISLALVILAIQKAREPQRILQMVNAAGLVLITYGTVALALIAKTHESLTAAIGILGALAGYFFGRMRTSTEGAPHGATDKEGGKGA